MPIVGNGMTLGLYQGKNSSNTVILGGLQTFGNSTYLVGNTMMYGSVAGDTNTVTNTGYLETGRCIGITKDPTKSGIVASLSDLDIGTINTLKLGSYILKY